MPRSSSRTTPEGLEIPVLQDRRCRTLMLGRLERRWPISAAAGDALDGVERAVLAAADQPIQIFVAAHHGNFPNLEYLAAGLRERGVYTVALYLLTPPPANTFDVAVELDGSVGALFEIFGRLPASSIYLQAHGRWTFLSQIIAAASPRHRVVQELWDWMDAFVPAGEEAVFDRDGVFTIDEIAAMRVSEAFVRDRCAGFTFKDGGPTMASLEANACAPSHRFLPCPPRAWMKQRRSRDSSTPWRLVHAGQLKNASTSVAVFGDLHYVPMIRRLTGQGIEVTAYGSATPPKLDPEGAFSDYATEAQDNPRFTFHSRLPVRTLIAEIGKTHDFGLLIYDFEATLRVGPDHLRSAIASKMFAYLAAGLPVLVSPQLETMAAFVREHRVGLVVEASAISTLQERLELEDYDAMLERVARVQSLFCLEAQLDGLLAFVAQCGAQAA